MFGGAVLSHPSLPLFGRCCFARCYLPILLWCEGEDASRRVLNSVTGRFEFNEKLERTMFFFVWVAQRCPQDLDASVNHSEPQTPSTRQLKDQLHERSAPSFWSDPSHVCAMHADPRMREQFTLQNGMDGSNEGTRLGPISTSPTGRSRIVRNRNWPKSKRKIGLSRTTFPGHCLS